MRHPILTLTLFSGLAFAASAVAAQTPFPLSDAPDSYAAPIIGVEPAVLMQEGRSVFAPAAAEGAFGLPDTMHPLDSSTSVSDLRLACFGVLFQPAGLIPNSLKIEADVENGGAVGQPAN